MIKSSQPKNSWRAAKWFQKLKSNFKCLVSINLLAAPYQNQLLAHNSNLFPFKNTGPWNSILMRNEYGNWKSKCNYKRNFPQSKPSSHYISPFYKRSNVKMCSHAACFCICEDVFWNFKTFFRITWWTNILTERSPATSLISEGSNTLPGMYLSIDFIYMHSINNTQIMWLNWDIFFAKGMKE